MRGDVTQLEFPNDSFDVVFCTEVLEHVAALQKACFEIEDAPRCGDRSSI